MPNIAVGILFLAVGLWYFSRDWYIYQHMLTVLLFVFMVFLGFVAFLAGLRQPYHNGHIVMENNRDITVDILRGFAVITMIAANVAAYALAQPHPFLLRLYGSFAAPIFIILSGTMIVFVTEKKKEDFGHFVTRGRLLVIVAALIDLLIWNIYPFTTMDMLYLIGISTPSAYFFQRLAAWQRWSIVCGIFLITPMLQLLFGYTSYPTQYYLWGQPTVEVLNQTSIINHWLIDGYFPVFPWLGFTLIGVNFGIWRWRDNREEYSFGNKRIFLVNAGLLIAGSIIWWLYPGSLLTRAGFSELFYPPTIGFILTAIGVIGVLFALIDYAPRLSVYRPLRVLGEFALFIYILHLVIIRYVIAVLWPQGSFLEFLLIYFVFSLLLIAVAYGLRALKEGWKQRPVIMQFLLSG